MTVYHTADDTRREGEVAAALGKAWGWEIHRFPKFEPIDFYGVKDDEIVGWIEVKNRNCSSTQYDTVFLSHLKWDRLYRYDTFTGKPGLFVVAYTDCIKWILAAAVDVTCPVLRGNGTRAVKEPMYLVPVSEMATVPRG